MESCPKEEDRSISRVVDAKICQRVFQELESAEVKPQQASSQYSGHGIFTLPSDQSTMCSNSKDTRWQQHDRVQQWDFPPWDNVDTMWWSDRTDMNRWHRSQVNQRSEDREEEHYFRYDEQDKSHTQSSLNFTCVMSSQRFIWNFLSSESDQEDEREEKSQSRNRVISTPNQFKQITFTVNLIIRVRQEGDVQQCQHNRSGHKQWKWRCVYNVKWMLFGFGRLMIFQDFKWWWHSLCWRIELQSLARQASILPLY